MTLSKVSLNEPVIASEANNYDGDDADECAFDRSLGSMHQDSWTNYK